jgi:predicted dehydrogenase
LIGCGGITEHHLKAYVAAGWDVAACYDLNPEAAENAARLGCLTPDGHTPPGRLKPFL